MMIINNLDTKKSSDIYDISPKIVRLTGQATAHCLSIILNRCIKGQFPTFLKLAKVLRLLWMTSSQIELLSCMEARNDILKATT